MSPYGNDFSKKNSVFDSYGAETDAGDPIEQGATKKVSGD